MFLSLFFFNGGERISASINNAISACSLLAIAHEAAAGNAAREGGSRFRSAFRPILESGHFRIYYYFAVSGLPWITGGGLTLAILHSVTISVSTSSLCVP